MTIPEVVITKPRKNRKPGHWRGNPEWLNFAVQDSSISLRCQAGIGIQWLLLSLVGVYPEPEWTPILAVNPPTVSGNIHGINPHIVPSLQQDIYINILRTGEECATLKRQIESTRPHHTSAQLMVAGMAVELQLSRYSFSYVDAFGEP